MVMTPQEKRVRRLERKFEKINEEVREFEDQYDELLDEYKGIIARREAALTELEISVRETRIPASGMTVSIVPRRIFDGQKLWTHFKNDPAIRDSLIKVEYKVTASKFDELQKIGHITGKLADKVILDVKETKRLNGRPKSFQMG